MLLSAAGFTIPEKEALKRTSLTAYFGGWIAGLPARGVQLLGGPGCCS